MRKRRPWRGLVAGIAATALALASLLLAPTASLAATGAGGTLYASQPILSDTFSSGTLAPFVANNGLTPGGSWAVENHQLVATDYGSSAPLWNQIAGVPNLPQNVVLSTTFTINRVNPQQYYRIGLFGRGSAPKSGASQWDLVLDHNTLSLINQFVSYPGSVPFSIKAGQSYHMMMVIDGTWVGGKVWAVGTSEPSGWTISAQFSNTGRLTTAGVAAGNADVSFKQFAVYPAPPSLTVTPSQSSAVFTGGTPSTYTAQLTANTAQEKGQYYVNYLVSDLNGNTVSQGQVPLFLRAGGTTKGTITLPRLPNGYYNTTFSLTNVSSRLRYQPQNQGGDHPLNRPSSSSGPLGGTATEAGTAPVSASSTGVPAAGHQLILQPTAPSTPAVPPQDLATSETAAPVENTTTSLAQVPAPASMSSLDPSSPFGINGPGNRYGPITAQRWLPTYQLLKKQGIQWVRTELMWNFVEPQPGVYTWNHEDGLVQAGHQANINLLGLLDYWGNYANPFAVNGGPKVSFATFLKDYDQFIQAVVRRYMPGGTLARQMGWHHYGITAWEVWNEPSTPQFWPSQNPTQYAELVHSATAAIRAVDPNATVLAYTWHPHTLVQVAGPQSFSGLSIHYYPGPVSPSQAQFYGGVQSLRQFLTRHQIGQDPIWMTESGWGNPVNMAQQAEYLVRAEVQSLAGSLNKFFVFTYQYPGSGFGELNGQYLPKPAYPALAGLSQQLTGMQPASSVNPVPMGSAIRAFVFTNAAANQSVAVLWSPTQNGKLTLAAPANVRAYDWMDNAIPVSGSGGLTVPLNGEPVYLDYHGSPTALAHLVRSGTVTGIAPVALSISRLHQLPTTLPQLQVSVTDQINVAQSGQLKLTLPSGWMASTGSTTTATYAPTVNFGPIAPGASTTDTFSLQRFEAQASNRYTLETAATVPAPTTSQHGSSTTTASTETVTSTLPLSVYQSVYGHAGMTGSFASWKQATPFYLDQSSQNAGIPNWSPAMESAVAYTMWGQHNFYFAAKVKDSVFYEPYTGFYQWAGDSIQLFFDPKNTKTPSYSSADGDVNFGLALTPVGPQAYEFQGPAPGLHSDIKLTILHGQHAGDLWYEAALPLADLPQWTNQTDHRYGFDMMINDSNGAGRLGWIRLTPGVGTFSPIDFPTFTQVNSAGLAAARLDSAATKVNVNFTPDSQGALLTVNNTGIDRMKVTLSNGTALTLVASSSAPSTATLTGTNPTVAIAPSGKTTINLVHYLTSGQAATLTATASVPTGASAILAVNNGVQ